MMPSYYDPKKKCRVGAMDEDQFYAECDKENGAFFRDLLAAWLKAGGELKWGAGGVGLRGAVGGMETGAKVVGVCFLAPQFAAKQDRIELACTMLANQIGAKRCEKFLTDLRSVAADRVSGKTMVCLIQPGKMPAAGPCSPSTGPKN